MAEVLHIFRQQDWYGVTGKDIAELGGSGILSIYDCSVAQTLKSVFPEFDWNPVQFQRTPRDHWTNVGNHEKFVKEVSSELNLDILDEGIM